MLPTPEDKLWARYMLIQEYITPEMEAKAQKALLEIPSDPPRSMEEAKRCIRLMELEVRKPKKKGFLLW